MTRECHVRFCEQRRGKFPPLTLHLCAFQYREDAEAFYSDLSKRLGKFGLELAPEKTRRHRSGEVVDTFSGYCKPARFEVTSMVKPGPNQITILCERKWLNEPGTGGLMGLVVVYREK